MRGSYRPSSRHLRAGRYSGPWHVRQGDYCPYRFVARNERKLGHAPLVVEHGKIGMTDSAMADLNLDFFRPKCARVEGEWFKRGMGCGGGVSVKLGRHTIR